jgi:hypothetical protein
MLGYAPDIREHAAITIQKALEKELNENIEVIISEGIEFIDKEDILRILSEK